MMGKNLQKAVADGTEQANARKRYAKGKIIIIRATSPYNSLRYDSVSFVKCPFSITCDKLFNLLTYLLYGLVNMQQIVF